MSESVVVLAKLAIIGVLLVANTWISLVIIDMIQALVYRRSLRGGGNAAGERKEW